tara:strand:- start:18469 stop:18654 length:186 start_codon:yes stop_codon:yes gene_type:complete
MSFRSSVAAHNTAAWIAYLKVHVQAFALGTLLMAACLILGIVGTVSKIGLWLKGQNNATET